MRPVTHRDIALRLNLNQSTVSRGLRVDPRISEKTRGRIHKASKEMGYQPNPRLDELVNLRWHKVKGRSDSVMACVGNCNWLMAKQTL